MGCLFSNCFNKPINPNYIDLSHFETYRCIGRGGYGRVDVVKHRINNELVAMKRYFKDSLVNKERAHVVWVEREVMSIIPKNSKFLVPLLCAFQTKNELCVIMPYLCGGDLAYHLRQNGVLSEDDVRFYASEILVGIETLHKLGYIYRDMKPENCLIDANGHIRLSDYGLCVRINDDKYVVGFAGTRRYMAPEILKNEAYTYSIDFWSFGVLLYELLQFYTPFVDEHEIINESIKPKFDHIISQDARSLVEQLLTRDVKKRLGYDNNNDKWDWNLVKKHNFFKNINWNKVYKQDYQPPFIPEENEIYFDRYYEAERQLIISSNSHRSLSSLQNRKFSGFDYNNKITKHHDDDDSIDHKDIEIYVDQLLPLKYESSEDL